MTKKDHILECAEELFAENGYNGTSVRALAQKAGVNIAMISYYFGSKEELFANLVEYRVSVLRERIQGIQKVDASSMEKMERLIDVYVDRIFSQFRFHRILHRQISLQRRSELNELIIQVLMKNVDEVRKLINEGIESGEFRKIDADLLIVTLTGTVSQLTLSSALSSRIMGVETEGCYFKDDQVTDRIKVYMKDLVSQLLLK